MEIPAGFAQANFRFGGTGVPHGAEFTLGLDVDAFSGTAADAATAAGGAALGYLLGPLCTTVTLTEVLVKFGPTDTGPSGVYPAAGVGGNSNAQAPPNVAYLVRKQTALGGRAGRGRFYLPGVDESQIGPGGVLAGALIPTLQTAIDDFAADLATSFLIPVLLHGAGSPITTPTPITGLDLDSTVATQRRRLRP